MYVGVKMISSLIFDYDDIYIVHIIWFVAHIRCPRRCAFIIYYELNMKYLNFSLLYPYFFVLL